MSANASIENQFLISKREDYDSVFKEIESLHGPQKIVLLQGDLGAGKTYFVRYCLEKMGVSLSEMSSPTFALIHRYHSPYKTNIYHVDLYRIEDESDLESTGFWDLLQEKEYLIFIEWAGKVQGKWWSSQSRVVELLIEKSDRLQPDKVGGESATFERRLINYTVLN